MDGDAFFGRSDRHRRAMRRRRARLRRLPAPRALRAARRERARPGLRPRPPCRRPPADRVRAPLACRRRCRPPRRRSRVVRPARRVWSGARADERAGTAQGGPSRRPDRRSRRRRQLDARARGGAGRRAGLPRPRRGGRRLARAVDSLRDRPQAHRGPARSPRSPRPSHGSAEPVGVRRPPRARTSAASRRTGRRRRAVHRPRRLQAPQRQLRPRRGRRRAARGGGADPVCRPPA